MALQYSDFNNNEQNNDSNKKNNTNKTRKRKIDAALLNNLTSNNDQSEKISQNALLNKNFAPTAFNNDDDDDATDNLGNYTETPKINGPSEYEKIYNDTQQVLGNIIANNKRAHESMQNENSNRNTESYGEYSKQYTSPTYFNQPSQNIQLDDKLLEKINYMIRLLENQKDEKTGNVTEKLILYCFLGIFIIFVIDSFVKVGKYTR